METYIEKASTSFVEKFSTFEAIVNKNSESYNKYKKEVDQACMKWVFYFLDEYPSELDAIRAPKP